MDYNVDNNFTAHSLDEDGMRRCEAVRSLTKTVAQELIALTPKSREQSLALTNLEQVMFWANAAIARNA